MIRIVLPPHLRTLAKVNGEVHIDANGTVRSLLDALEEKYPVLRGTIRDHEKQQRRSLVRFFACGEDISHQAPDTSLPEPVRNGTEPFFIVGAIAGG
jgi:sulfur-carrier protein